ncbi:MAG: hypothetical protein JKY95_03590 [Planctomycetaceae bacterium]|nr:hypothetical protein [Planctomycetaceae bacterium]
MQEKFLLPICLAMSILLLSASQGSAQPVPETKLPHFIVPGYETQMESMNDLFARHHNVRTRCALWDAWLPMSVLWPAVGEEHSAQKMREFYRDVFLTRFVDAQGYVTMDQHMGLAHPTGWPFPTWQQAAGAGWHFTHHGDGYARSLGIPVATTQGWKLEGIEEQGLDPMQGLKLKLTQPHAVLTTPECNAHAFAAPFIVLQWNHKRLPLDVVPVLQWTTTEFSEFSTDRQMAITPEIVHVINTLSFSSIPVHKHPQWKGSIKQLRIQWNNPAPIQITVRALHTAVDTRHPITNIMFVNGSIDYFDWTTDVDFLQKNISRMRSAMKYAVQEFSVQQNGCMLVPWVGHNGKQGFDIAADGKKTVYYGQGVGNNYWDLLPFGHKDCLGTIYLFNALNQLSNLEAAIANHPEWKIPSPDQEYSSAQLSKLAQHVKKTSTQLFWNSATKRFVACIDIDGVKHDYGYTFLNLEAIYYGFATDEQAQDILDWVDGKRIVAGDTSQGKEIYHWEFAPRATTKRNIEWYVWPWTGPETIPWGGQVQDGGAVLGFSYHDMMARLKTKGPDDAWQRMQSILSWYDKVHKQGGYREYFSKPGRGTLQGGGTAGGLGIDHEFYESALVPQTMLYGFLGFKPLPEGFAMNPQLPSSWPSLTITGIHVQDHVLSITVKKKTIEIQAEKIGKHPLRIFLPKKTNSPESKTVAKEDSLEVLIFTPENKMAIFSR